MVPTLTALAGFGDNSRKADAIVHNPTVQRMLRSYGVVGGWQIQFFENADEYCRRSSVQTILFLDSLNELRALRAEGLEKISVYLLAPDDDAIAEDAEALGVKALLTCPEHWFPL